MSPSTIERCAALVAALIASACRLGGPSGDPTSPIADGSAGWAGAGENDGHAGSGQGGAAGAGGQGVGGASSGASGEHDGANPGGAAGAAVDASIDMADEVAPEDGGEGDDALVDIDALGDMVDADASETAPPTGCLPPFSSAICDPVCNTGCPALFRCDTTDMPRTGVCVGTLLSSVNEGMACTRTAVTDDCLERLSCVAGICRRLCYRDAECTTAGTCCNTTVDVDGGPSGYRICAPCMP